MMIQYMLNLDDDDIEDEQPTALLASQLEPVWMNSLPVEHRWKNQKKSKVCM